MKYWYEILYCSLWNKCNFEIVIFDLLNNLKLELKDTQYNVLLLLTKEKNKYIVFFSRKVTKWVTRISKIWCVMMIVQIWGDYHLYHSLNLSEKLLESLEKPSRGLFENLKSWMYQRSLRDFILNIWEPKTITGEFPETDIRSLPREATDQSYSVLEYVSFSIFHLK